MKEVVRHTLVLRSKLKNEVGEENDGWPLFEVYLKVGEKLDKKYITRINENIEKIKEILEWEQMILDVCKVYLVYEKHNCYPQDKESKFFDFRKKEIQKEDVIQKIDYESAIFTGILITELLKLRPGMLQRTKAYKVILPNDGYTYYYFPRNKAEKLKRLYNEEQRELKLEENGEIECVDILD